MTDEAVEANYAEDGVDGYSVGHNGQRIAMLDVVSFDNKQQIDIVSFRMS